MLLMLRYQPKVTGCRLEKRWARMSRVRFTSQLPCTSIPSTLRFMGSHHPLLSCHWHWIGIPKKEGITRGREQRCYQTSNSVFQMRELSKRGSLQGHEESHTFPSVTQPLNCRYEIWPKGFPGPGVLAHFIISCCFSPLALSVQSFHPFIRKELFQREQHLYWQWEIGGEMLMAT